MEKEKAEKKPRWEPQKHDMEFPWNEEVVLVSGKGGNLVRVEELAKELGIKLKGC